MNNIDIIADESFIKHIFLKESDKRNDVDLILDYIEYHRKIIETIPQILNKYVDSKLNVTGALFFKNIVSGWGNINFPEIEPWSEEVCILELCNVSCYLKEKVWLITSKEEKDYMNLKKPDGTISIKNNRVEVWNINHLIEKIKADKNFINYIHQFDNKAI